ncbi:MAG: lysophospholipid acyltransferase family protein [Gammaproteobacteria bacterium]|jgi:KDO2-lipid IV(A) lauroyltransferase
MKIFFYILSILPVKFIFLFLDISFKFLPLSFLRIFSPFKVTRKNLSIVFPDTTSLELDMLAKESFKETIKSLYETLYTWSRSSQNIIFKVKKINNRFLFNGSNHEDGLIIFAPHNRSIDFMLRWISTQRPHTSLYKKIKFSLIDQFVKKFREEENCKMVETGIGGVKSILNALEKNQMTCMASDQVPADGLGTYSKFFGHECYSFALAPKLARKTKKEILLTYLSYKRDIGHIINFKRPSVEIYEKNGVDVMNKEMEDEIRKSPSEYSWEYKKFRKLSGDIRDIYKN